MPQMMPINWMMSFLFFICIYIMFNILNYYIFYYKINFKNMNKTYKKNKLNWKW
uniref:ATP synthase complex subunit 8 n=2 Tax=Polyommatinae TaxID=42297 RepID=M4K7C9_CUPAG|nr:ATP synthase F0 subunit 8 [Cupido argiades]AGE31674.1 ATP synthase F0 subunit 8 [Cupido argiades]QJF47660.1 ATP synthase F0 subunit 8 [Plebejus argus]